MMFILRKLSEPDNEILCKDYDAFVDELRRHINVLSLSDCDSRQSSSCRDAKELLQSVCGKQYDFQYRADLVPSA